MAENNWDQVRHDKDAYRAKLASLPVSEKVAIMERLRHRAEEIRGSATPVSARFRETISNVRVVQLNIGLLQRVTSNIRLGVLGADATSVAFAMMRKGY